MGVRLSMAAPKQATPLLLQVGKCLACCRALPLSQGDKVVSCEHESDEFLPLAIYTATVNQIGCVTGETVDSQSWQWLTMDSLL